MSLNPSRVIARKAIAILNCSAIRLQYFLVLILRTSRDTTKLGFLKLGVLNVGILNFSCFETGCFGFGAIRENWAI
jgi:hypothetical protein